MFFPPTQGLSLDIDAISGICGSISVACWVVVFSPQIIENFVRSSADGLSLTFLIVWLAGDVFNILGAVLQGVLPTMIILAIYYTFADLVLLAQCFYYRGFTLSDAPTGKPTPSDPESSIPTERTHLLYAPEPHTNGHNDPPPPRRRLSSLSSLLVPTVDPTHLSPVTPLLDPPAPGTAGFAESLRPTTVWQAIIFNAGTILLVVCAGVIGWWLSPSGKKRSDEEGDTLEFSTLGQIFGYLCAALYLASRIPQLLLNHRRKSTEGVSLLFFLFACIGNLTYVLSIFAFEPRCRAADGWGTSCPLGEWGRLYARYILVNTSWLVGSLGALLLDCGILAQFLIYSAGLESVEGSEGSEGEEVAVYDDNAVRVVVEGGNGVRP